MPQNNFNLLLREYSADPILKRVIANEQNNTRKSLEEISFLYHISACYNKDKNIH